MDKNLIDFVISVIYALQEGEEDKRIYAFLMSVLYRLKNGELDEDSLVKIYSESMSNPDKIIKEIASRYGWV